MSTRSRIASYDSVEGTFTSIYCHHDGYPEHNGRILFYHYQDDDKIQKLLDLGKLSVLGRRLAPDPPEEHSFENPAQEVCLAYARDRDNDPSAGIAFEEASLGSLMAHTSETGCEYLYLWMGGEWGVYFVHDPNWDLKPIFNENQWAKLETVLNHIGGGPI